MTAWRSVYLETTYHVLGWMAFFSWTICFYPQVLLNFHRKSVVGLNFDFVVLNLTKHSSYLIYNAALFFSPEIQRQYHEKYGYGERLSGFRNNKLAECLTRFPQLVSSENQPKNGGTKLFLSLAQMIPVAANDVAFSIHAVLVTCFISFQILIYERGNQKVSKICIVVSSAAWAIVLVCLIISWPKHSWLWLISVVNTIQVAITAIKYIPQAFMNFSSKSTIGWSIGFVLLDLSGGMLNFGQMAMQSIDQGTMINFYGNLGKTLLSLVVVFFDLLFIIQHYVLYPMAKNETNQILIEEAVAPLIDSPEKSE